VSNLQQTLDDDVQRRRGALRQRPGLFGRSAHREGTDLPDRRQHDVDYDSGGDTPRRRSGKQTSLDSLRIGSPRHAVPVLDGNAVSGSTGLKVAHHGLLEWSSAKRRMFLCTPVDTVAVLSTVRQVLEDKGYPWVGVSSTAAEAHEGGRKVNYDRFNSTLRLRLELRHGELLVRDLASGVGSAGMLGSGAAMIRLLGRDPLLGAQALDVRFDGPRRSGGRRRLGSSTRAVKRALVKADLA
jgi:hypothetical protein